MISPGARIAIGLTRPAICRAAKRLGASKQICTSTPSDEMVEEIAVNWMEYDMKDTGDVYRVTWEEILEFVIEVLPLILKILVVLERKRQRGKK